MSIIIEASNTYFGGGYVLLEQILLYNENYNIVTKVYIGYTGVYNELKKRNYKYIHLEKTNTFLTIYRYFKHRENVLFFCNLPPYVYNTNSVLYAHNILFFKTPTIDKKQSVLFNLKKYIYYCWLKLFHSNVDVVACQTEDVKESLFMNLNIYAELYPFYKKLDLLPNKKEYDFCYISSASPHKNHKNLFKAIRLLAEKKEFKISVTIPIKDEFHELLEIIHEINNKFSREIIINLGMISNEQVIGLYSASRALVFPSLAETIALPLIEAIQCGLTVLSADRPYTWQVIENPIIFDPENSLSIITVMENFLNNSYKDTIQKVKVQNRLPDLINFLQH